MLHTPVAFIIFNRPDLTEIVFEAIRAVRPAVLLVVADGPRNEVEKDKCQQARDIIKRVDWNCKVLTNYSDVNLGCKNRVSSGINWVFEQVDEAIILEDDCLPHPSFFAYCETLLGRYRNDTSVMHISGANFQDGIVRGNGSYYFSKYSHIWGWATWKRAWNSYDVSVVEWPEYKVSEQFVNWCFDDYERKTWEDIVENVYDGNVDTWDFQWFFAIMKKNGHCVMPNNNMISNIGFRPDATHTQEANSQMAKLPVTEYLFPDVEVPVGNNEEADRYTFNKIFNASYNVEAHCATEGKRRSVLLNSIKGKLKSLKGKLNKL